MKLSIMKCLMSCVLFIQNSLLPVSNYCKPIWRVIIISHFLGQHAWDASLRWAVFTQDA